MITSTFLCGWRCACRDVWERFACQFRGTEAISAVYLWIEDSFGILQDKCNKPTLKVYLLSNYSFFPVVTWYVQCVHIIDAISFTPS